MNQKKKNTNANKKKGYLKPKLIRIKLEADQVLSNGCVTLYSPGPGTDPTCLAGCFSDGS